MHQIRVKVVQSQALNKTDSLIQGLLDSRNSGCRPNEVKISGFGVRVQPKLVCAPNRHVQGRAFDLAVCSQSFNLYNLRDCLQFYCPNEREEHRDENRWCHLFY